MNYKILNIPTLNSNDIFAYSVGEECFLYAPLSGAVCGVTKDEIAELESELEKGSRDSENEFLKFIRENATGVFSIKSLHQSNELTILLNQICNFTCAYCYSAKGRSNVSLDTEKTRTVLEYFIRDNENSHLEIVFSGGGDPVLSFGTFSIGVEYAKEIAEKEGKTIRFGIVTNGSRLNDEYLDFIVRNKIELIVSFDILEDVHNAQRSSYDIVSCTLDKLISRGIQFGIRSTITPLNVNRMHEMVEELHNRFPEVKSAAFEVVLNDKLFASVEGLRSFYVSFKENIFRAVDLGDNYGISIGNTIINNIDACKDRACLGKFVVTPDGKITACSRISSSKEDFYNYFLYGSIEDDGINIDSARYSALNNENVYTHKECGSCIAKWHCSGGCLLARHVYDKEYFDEYCRFMQEMTIETLIRKFN